jgi:hypothetical protein
LYGFVTVLTRALHKIAPLEPEKGRQSTCQERITR